MGGFRSHGCPPQGLTDRLQTSGRGWRGQPQGLLAVPVFFSYVGPSLPVSVPGLVLFPSLDSPLLGLFSPSRGTPAPPSRPSQMVSLQEASSEPSRRSQHLSPPDSHGTDPLLSPCTGMACGPAPLTLWTGNPGGQGLVCAPSTQQ